MSDVQLERELKFAVPDEFEIPDLASLLPAGGSVVEQVVHLESVYYDTTGRDLLGAGLTLRRRTGDTDTGWQLKVPAGDARSEIRVPLGGRGVPAELRALTAGIRGRAALRPVATLRTRRRVVRLLDADGAGIVEFADDAVTSHTQREFAITRTWREVEVELGAGRPKILRRAARLLYEHGATDATIGSKLVHALDVSALPRPETDTLSGVVAAFLADQFEALVSGDIGLRRGDDVVHPTRVATRRYRSVLRVFGELLDPVRARHLDGELRWFAAALGGLRDTQVLRRHFAHVLDDEAPELAGSVTERITAALDADEATARSALHAHLAGARHVALLRELRSWREHVPIVTDAPASKVAIFLDKAERTSENRLRQARGTDQNDEAYHRARKAAKRTRYVGELAEPVAGSKARKAIKRARTIQQRFGDRQDVVMAAEFLQRIGSHTDGFALGVLYAHQRSAIT